MTSAGSECGKGHHVAIFEAAPWEIATWRTPEAPEEAVAPGKAPMQASAATGLLPRRVKTSHRRARGVQQPIECYWPDKGSSSCQHECKGVATCTNGPESVDGQPFSEKVGLDTHSHRSRSRHHGLCKEQANIASAGAGLVSLRRAPPKTSTGEL